MGYNLISLFLISLKQHCLYIPLYTLKYIILKTEEKCENR